jgi:hypothetical protein
MRPSVAKQNCILLFFECMSFNSLFYIFDKLKVSVGLPFAFYYLVAAASIKLKFPVLFQISSLPNVVSFVSSLFRLFLISSLPYFVSSLFRLFLMSSLPIFVSS